MPKKLKIFLSAATAQFKDCREQLRSDLAAVGAEVVVQEDFTQKGYSLLKKLEDYIADCDRVIALVGTAYGWEPEAGVAPKHTQHRSYTQWEYYFALGERLDGSQESAKPVYVYFASESFLENYPVDQSIDATAKQQQFINEILESGKDRNDFDTLDKLGRLVLRDGFEIQGVGRLIQNLPYDSLGSLFKGRKRVLNGIRDNFTQDSAQATAIVAKQAIHGLGGIGKTRLAVEYAWQFLADYQACLFISAESPESMNSHLAGLCHKQLLDLPEQQATEQELQAAATLCWLQSNDDWLLILDNIDNEVAAAAVEKLLPSLQNGHVLLTSRLTNWGNSIHSLSLDTLELTDAVAFLLEKTAMERRTTDQDESAATILCETLDGLALALEQVGAYINHFHISFEDYLECWEARKSTVQQWHDPRLMKYPSSLATTWETSFQQLDEHAQALLNLLCWFSAEPIPRDLFADVFTEDSIMVLLPKKNSTDKIAEKSNQDSPVLEALLDQLDKLSLIRWESGYHSFSVHRLVQEITKTRLPDETQQQGLQAALDLIDAALPSDPPPDDVRAWPVWSELRPHMEKLLQEADEDGTTHPAAQLLNEFGVYLMSKSLFKDAEPRIQRALAIDEKSLGPVHPNVARDLNNLAQLLHVTNRLKDAEPLMRRALAIDEKSFGTEHPNVAINLNNLAALLKDTSRLEDAEPLMQRALAIDEASFGTVHPNVARDLNNLAQLLQDTNRLEEAEPLTRRALAIEKKYFGSEHPRLAAQFTNLARLLKDSNRLEDAEHLLRRALSINEKSFGPEHPRVAASLNNLAQLLQDMNRLKDAEPLMRRALAIDEKSFGSEHPKVAIRLNNLAQLLQDTNRLEDAEPASRKAVEILELFTLQTGHQHPHRNTTIANYRALLAAMGFDEARQQTRLDEVINTVREKFNQQNEKAP